MSYPNILAMKLYLLILLFTTILLNINCKKQNICTDPVCQIPPVTQTGANTFGCLVDGKPWTANTGLSFSVKPLYIGAGYIDGKYFLKLSARQRQSKEGIDSNIDIFIEGANKKGVFLLNINDAIGPRISTPISSVGVYRISDNYTYPYETDSAHTGQVTITRYDAANKIAAGTFYFTAQNVDNDSIVHITDGRFDVILP